MESLESKLDHLTPQERREVEDFVDFLIQRAGGSTVPAMATPQVELQAPPVMKVAPPPLIVPETLPADEVPDNRLREPSRTLVQVRQPIQIEETTSPIQEITVGDDHSDGFLDYGKFEKAVPAPFPPSPADDAIKKVKIKLIKKSEAESKTKLLDWID